MCLAYPGKVVKILNENQALVDFGGVKKAVNTSLVDDVKIGEYLLVHAGYAIQVMDEEEAKKTIEIWKELLESI